MAGKRSAPFGSWRSPITATLLAEGGVRLGEVRTAGRDVTWLELRPAEGGRSVVVRRTEAGEVSALTPTGLNVRTLVHEYGGGAYAVFGSSLFFSNFEDQRVYRQEAGRAPGAVTPPPPRSRAVRYADFELSADGAWLYCVRETHAPGSEARNELVALPADGRGEARVIDSRHDFVSFPRLCPAGRRLAWTSWEHPRMPWDGTELWIAEVRDGKVDAPERVAGGEAESIFQPAWSPDGVLHFVSDRTGWWNLYRLRDGSAEPLAPMEAEFGRPQWGFAMATYAFLPDGRIVCTWTQDGTDRIGVLAPGAGRPEPIDTPYSVFIGPAAFRDLPDRVALVAASATEAPAVITLDVRTGSVDVLKRSHEAALDPATLSPPRAIEFPTAGGRTAHALYYRPASADHTAPPDERPPLVVMSHGGPTGAASSALNYAIQFFTSRGLAVVDVNYGGSTGYGRAYRERLRSQWGIVDTEDCIHAARWLVEQGLVDGRRMAIRGGSAGGYTTLCALTFHDVFAAGASYYGVADAEALARDTHKFESRYLDSLIGPYPEARDRYRERSPIHFADRLSCPLLLLQGLEDAIVPPSQAEVMVEALRRRGLPYAYVPFAGEQHGFRRAESIVRAHQAELAFYGRIFGFEPADPIAPLRIENL